MTCKRFEDQFTVHVIFRNFFNGEIQLSGDWRVALSENFFPTKIEHITNGVLIYSLSGLEDHQRNSSEANVISRPYNGDWLGFIPGSFANVPMLLATIKRTVGLPKFSFREIKSSGKFETLFGKYEGITFPSDEIPCIIGFRSSLYYTSTILRFPYLHNSDLLWIFLVQRINRRFLSLELVIPMKPTLLTAIPTIPTKPTETDKNRQKPTLLTSKTDETEKNRQKPTLRTSFLSVFLKEGILAGMTVCSKLIVVRIKCFARPIFLW